MSSWETPPSIDVKPFLKKANDLSYCGNPKYLNIHNTGLNYGEDDGNTVVFDLNKGCVHLINLTGNRTFSFINGDIGQTFNIKITKTLGNKTVIWTSGISWISGENGTLTITGNKWYWYKFIKLADNLYDNLYISKYN